MTEVDPWATPQDAPQPASMINAFGGSVPPQTPPPPRPILPLNRVLPFVVLGAGVAYVLVGLLEVYALYRRASIAGRIADGDGSVTLDQVNSADHLVSGISVLSIVVFVGALVAISVWQRSLRTALAPLGVYSTVLKEAGYPVFRAAWLVSFVMSLFLNSTNTTNSLQDVISHDHKYMVYYLIRAAVGVVLIVMSLRLKRISEQSVSQLQAAQGIGYAGYMGPGVGF